MVQAENTKAEELRGLIKRLNFAVEAYTGGHVHDTNEIVKQCQHMLHRAETPEVFAERLRYQPLDLCALMIAIQGGSLNCLVNLAGQSADADQLAMDCARPREEIVRSLRLLTAIGVCDEVGYQKYRANEKTDVVASRGQVGGFRVSSVPVSGILPRIEEFFGKCADGTLDGTVDSAYVYTYGKPMYEVLRETGLRGDFDAYMESRKKEKSRRWHHAFPATSKFVSEFTTATIVDVGGSQGHDLISFHDEMPGFRGRLILQDLPETVQEVLGQPQVFEAMAYDFFTPQPVKHADVYLLLAVLHNWSDDACVRILKTLAAAMRPGHSRLLISAMLLPDIDAERRAAELDIQMWLLQLSRQRTETEVKLLLSDAGLSIVTIWPNGNRESIVEACVQEQ